MMTVNEAIVKVIKAKYKKECPEAFDIVEKAGYRIEKWNGVWHVCKYYDKYVYRGVYYKPNQFSWNRFDGYLCVNRTKGDIRLEKAEDIYKINIEGVLNKPFIPYKPTRHEEWEDAKRNLKHYKWSVQYEESELRAKKDNLTNAMNSYERTVNNYYESKANLEDFRKRIGLKK